jgi:tryptophanyl-tRNA synthetase
MRRDYEVVSAIQPSGFIHIGNYFGAIRNWVKLQDEYKCIYGVVDLHAMTRNPNPKNLKKWTDQMIIDLLACGIDPSRTTLFVQSLVPEHTELTWILSNLANYGELSRQPQFKKYQEENSTIRASFFNYPVLQAADILIYHGDFVPVGDDQRQHLELCRHVAERFNSLCGQEYFQIPEAKYTPTPRIKSFADPTRKMSKSAGEKHYLKLFEEEAIIRKKIKSAVTDSGETPEGEMSKGVDNLFNILKACGKSDEVINLTNDFFAGNLKYAHLKEATADALVELSTELINKRKAIEKDTSLINDTIRELSANARTTAQKTIYEVKKLMGLKCVSHF